MKTKILILISALFILASCNAAKQSQQSRNLMMPGKADLPRNDKYSAPKKKKTYKPKTKKKKKKSYTWTLPEQENRDKLYAYINY